MSDDNKGASGTSTDAAGGQSGNDTVSYQTYKKAVGEVKKLKEQLDSIMTEKQQHEQEILAEQGKYKEIAEKFQKDLKEKEELLRKKDSLFVQQNLRQSVARVAKELGAKEEAIDEIFEVGRVKEYWKAIEVKDDYSINLDQVKSAVSEMTQKSPWFFVKQANAPKDVVIGGTQVTTEVDMKKMSKDQLLDMYRKVLNK
jgi:predicted nuclease with TOPRIM domain